ncbi:MAG: radical SAM protein [Deltaproteobacteria bacterium]|nr:radical SAM protein [Deltaproteobacteria bacterium]
MPFIEHLDEIPFPAWDLVNISHYRLPITNRPFLLVLTGRGCPYPCKFCAAGTLYGKKPRFRSPQKIVEEIKYVRDTFGVRDFLFWSENSISDRKHIYDISEGLSLEAPGIRWVCNGRVDMIDHELLSAMKQAGCWMIGYGVEAGTQRVLDLMDKRTKIDDIEKAVALTKKAGIEVTGHVIVGYPGETRKEIFSTLKLLKRMDPDYIQVYCSVPFPGAPVYNEAREGGLINTLDWTRYEQNFSIIDTPELSGSEVMELRDNIIKDFYLNPRKIAKTLLKIRKPVEVLFFLSFSFRYFLSWVRKA